MYNKPVSVYNVEFEEKEANEEQYARQVANQFPGKINYKVIQGLDGDLIHDLDYFVNLEEEPFLSPNLYTDFHLQRRLKKEGIGVNINGAGGDELLAGYEFEYLPPHLNYLMRNNKKAYFSQLSDLLVNNKYKLRTKGRLFLESIGLKAQITETKQNYLNIESGYDMAFSRDFNQLMLNNFKDYKMNYWLRSSAKSFYGIPMEARNPLLDADLIEYCFKLPPEYLINKGWHKYILRKAIEDILPKEIVWRKNKMGFPFTLNQWLTKNKRILEPILQLSQSPLALNTQLAKDYDKLIQRNPTLLWRLISLEMWYRKVVLKEQLV
jgi:asparagine synthase (glutamine-hydrolysing)